MLDGHGTAVVIEQKIVFGQALDVSFPVVDLHVDAHFRDARAERRGFLRRLLRRGHEREQKGEESSFHSRTTILSRDLERKTPRLPWGPRRLVDRQIAN